MDTQHQLEPQPSKRPKVHGNPYSDAANIQAMGRAAVRSGMDTAQEAAYAANRAMEGVHRFNFETATPASFAPQMMAPFGGPAAHMFAAASQHDRQQDRSRPRPEFAMTYAHPEDEQQHQQQQQQAGMYGSPSRSAQSHHPRRRNEGRGGASGASAPSSPFRSTAGNGRRQQEYAAHHHHHQQGSVSADDVAKNVRFEYPSYYAQEGGQGYAFQQQQQQQQQAQHPRVMMVRPSNISAMTSTTQLPGGLKFTTVHGSSMHAATPPATPSSASIDDTELATSPRRHRNRAVRIDEDTVTWLRANFELKTGFTVERRLVYKAYCRHMQSMMQEPCNAAGFGKVIRGVFPGVTSRRLGSRGHSKYHYEGLRIKPSSAVAMLRLADEETEATTHDSNSMLGMGSSSSVTSPISRISTGTLMMLMHSMDKSLQLPGFPHLELEEVGVAVTERDTASLEEDIASFCELYRNHCVTMLEAVKSVSFGNVYAMIHAFWTDLPDRMRQLLPSEGLSNKIELWDSILYDTMLHVFVPEILRPVGTNAHRTIVTFVEDIVSTVKDLESLDANLPPNIIRAKKAAAEVLQEIMQRRMALNNLAQAGMKMLNSHAQVEQMRTDLDRVNLKAIKRESAWVTDCPDAFVDRIFAELLEFLDQPRGLSYASHWLDSIVKRTFKSMVGIDFDAMSVDSGSHDHSSPSYEHLPPLDSCPPAPALPAMSAGRGTTHQSKQQVQAATAEEQQHTKAAASQQKQQPGTQPSKSTSSSNKDGVDTSAAAKQSSGASADSAGAGTSSPTRSTPPPSEQQQQQNALEAQKTPTVPSQAGAKGSSAAEDARRKLTLGPASTPSERPDAAQDSDSSKNTEVERMELLHKTARKLLQAWTFYSSQILRELTMKSAPSFGSCNVLKLLMDEYMYYLIHTRVTHPHKEIVHPDIIVHTTGTGTATDTSSQTA